MNGTGGQMAVRARVKALLLSYPVSRRLIQSFRDRAAQVAVRLAGERRMSSLGREELDQLALENYRLRATIQRMQASAAAARDAVNGAQD
jgi:hypothetical protein